MRRFYLHKRDDIFYAELVDPETGLRSDMGFRSLGHPATCTRTDGRCSPLLGQKRMGRNRLIDVSHTELKAHLLRLSPERLAPATLNKALAAVSAPLAWAARSEIIPVNPAKGASHTSREKVRNATSSRVKRYTLLVRWTGRMNAPVSHSLSPSRPARASAKSMPYSYVMLAPISYLSAIAGALPMD